MLWFEIIVKYQYHWCHYHSLDSTSYLSGTASCAMQFLLFVSENSYYPFSDTLRNWQWLWIKIRIHFFQFLVYLLVCLTSQQMYCLHSCLNKNYTTLKKKWLLIKYCWCAMEILTLTLNFGVVAFKFNHKLVCKSCRLFKISAFNLPKEPHFEETLLLLKSLLARE